MRSGEVHVIMGPNGSGKSTLAHALAGHPGYRVVDGSVTLDGVDLLALSPTERARHGLLLALQQPLEVPGVRPSTCCVAAGADPQGLRRAHARRGRAGRSCDPRSSSASSTSTSRAGSASAPRWSSSASCARRFAVLDEIDSGLDVDALGAVARRLAAVHDRVGLRRPRDHALSPAALRTHPDDDPRA